MDRLIILGLLALWAAPLLAGVGPEQAARLGQDLTPLGAERAGNARGTIPRWEGALRRELRDQEQQRWWQGLGLRKVMAWWRDEPPEARRYPDPFSADRPVFTINADNMDAYREHLSPGQQALFRAHPDSYRMPVYPSRRPVGAPDWIYAAVARNAQRARLDGHDDALVGAMHGVPFPIPQQGAEVIWNHKLRFRGQQGTRWNVQSVVDPGGEIRIMKVEENLKFRYYLPELGFDDLDNVYFYVLQKIHAPPRMAGAVVLVHETMDQVREPRKAWVMKPGESRINRAATVGYDNPGTASDGQRTNDQADVFNGALDRYDWRLAGKREIYVPYNAYRLHDGAHRYADILRPGHINQDLARYELHRVWVVEATVKPRASHMYKRRTFYVDEDSWHIVLVDVYDAQDELWRVQEAHTFFAYDQLSVQSAIEPNYDLKNGRYLTQAMNNEDAPWVEHPVADAHYAPRNVQRRAGAL